MEDAVVDREEHEEAVEEIFEIQKLTTHTNILKNNSYTILALSDYHAKVKIDADKCERVKESGLIYDGSIFSAATFAATAAVNEENMFLIGVNIDLLNPVKEQEDLIFDAEVQVSSSGKKIVNVAATINDIIFMQGTFILLKLDNKSLMK